MAIGLFGLEDCEHGIALPGHLFHADTALEDLGAALKARTPGASRAHSRLASPAPLVLDSWCEDESLSSASDLFDSPASWFSEEDGFGSLAGLRSAPQPTYDELQREVERLRAENERLRASSLPAPPKVLPPNLQAMKVRALPDTIPGDEPSGGGSASPGIDEAPFAGATPGAVAPVIPHERTEAAEMRALQEELQKATKLAAEYKQQNEDLLKQLEEIKLQAAQVCVRDEGGGGGG